MRWRRTGWPAAENGSRWTPHRGGGGASPCPVKYHTLASASHFGRIFCHICSTELIGAIEQSEYRHILDKMCPKCDQNIAKIWTHVQKCVQNVTKMWLPVKNVTKKFPKV